jgi:hypothetical protein
MKYESTSLTFDSLIACCRQHFETLSDPRKHLKQDSYPLADVLMSGLAMFHFQDPALLHFQEMLEESDRRSNLTTMFGVTKTPKDSQMRTILDGVAPGELVDVFTEVHRMISAAKVLPTFRVLEGRFLVAIDASDYFSSEKCHCDHCLQVKDKDGKVLRYHHQILQAVMLAPGVPQVLPIGSEEVCLQDGDNKQDCEINAAKRLIPWLASNHAHRDLVIIADGLYSHVPFVSLLRQHGLDFILVAKPSDHLALHDDLTGLRMAGAIGSFEQVDKEGRRHVYEFCRDVVIRADGEQRANWFSYRLINRAGKITFQNDWITSLPVTARNVAHLVECGRSRWKIENEGFNTLKNQGYHLEHNFGHGKKHLSFVFFLLNLLAFTIHELLELRDRQLTKLYEKVGSWREVWIKLRVMVETFVFDGWNDLLKFLLDKRTRYARVPT